MDLGGVLKGKENVAPSVSIMNHSIFEHILTNVIFLMKTHNDLVNLINFQIPLYTEYLLSLSKCTFILRLWT